jgi:O-antigen ligase
MRVNRKHALLGTLFVVGVLPSVVFSTDIKTSLQFLFGVGVCLIIMGSMYGLTRAIGMRAVGMLVWIYRITVIITIPLFVSGLQYRGHFSLYEASYWAIALIPYYCIAFHKLLKVGKRAFFMDGLFILVAIIISQSVSMVIWVILSFVGLLIAMRMVRIRYVIVAAMTFVILGAVAYKFSTRAEGIFDALWNIADWDSLVSLLILVGGNRLQRALVAYQAFHDHPILGVGLGALKNFTDLHFRAGDFSLTGMSAMDFETSLPATNVLLELAAECGIIGLLAFLVLLRFIFKQCKNKPAVIPFRIALWVTMLSLIFESSYLRPYVWMLYGISLGLSSLHAEIKPKRRFPKIRLFSSTREIASAEPPEELLVQTVSRNSHEHEEVCHVILTPFAL